MSKNFARLDTYDLERVEVLQGTSANGPNKLFKGVPGQYLYQGNMFTRIQVRLSLNAKQEIFH